MSITLKYSYLEQAYPDMLEGIGALIQKAKLAARFTTIELSEDEKNELHKAKELCELRIMALWENRESTEFVGLCSTYFDLASQLPVEGESDSLIYEQFKVIAFGYLGEHWHFVRQYVKSRDSEFETMQIGQSWSHRLLAITFKAIVTLVKKEDWTDIEQAVGLINQLRREQNEYENSYLSQVNEENRIYGAAELASLYHFAKCIDILGQYLLEGRPLDPENEIKYHTGIALDLAQKSGNISLSLLYQFFEAFAIKMSRNTIWYTTRGINNWVTQFNEYISNREKKGLFELLYPQRESIIEGELLNPAHRAVVINLPTSSGKTLISEYRMLQALNQFRERGGWVAYIVPTKTLVNQVYVQLRKDLSKIGIRIEKASGAIDLDGFEQHFVEDNGNATDFDILVTTYEKLNLLVRQGLGTTSERPLVLTVVDEAHNIEDVSRGLNLEFLLSTIKNDCEEANFLLMTPDISNSSAVTEWLAGDRGNVINLELDWWQPNERIVGAVKVEGRARNYDYVFQPLHTDKGTYAIGEEIMLHRIQQSEQTASNARASKVTIATSIASWSLSQETPVIVLASNPTQTYRIAEELYKCVGNDIEPDGDVELVIKFVRSELGEDFPLGNYLKRRIAVHSAALPDEIRLLIEDLMANGKLQALVATTTIAQGINFPVSSIIMGAYNYPYSGDMPVRDFWNLAGRVGRAGQDSMGWVAMAVRDPDDLAKAANYVKKASDALHSQLVNAIDAIEQVSEDDFDQWLFRDGRWSAILQYISHLRRQTQEQNAFLAQLELKLQSTFGYGQLSNEKKAFLRTKLRAYVSTLSLSDAKKADETGFSSISVRQMRRRLAAANIASEDWQRNQLFSENNRTMQNLVGIMLNTHEIRKSINELTTGGQPMDRSSIAKLIIEWVNGREVASIAARIHPTLESTPAVIKTSKALYTIIANSATWGLAAIQQMPTSGIDWENLSETERRKMANLPAYIHYGVNTDEGVLMRKHNVPRSIANRLGELYGNALNGDIFNQASGNVIDWLSQQPTETWNRARPIGSNLSGADYKRIWGKLNGE